MLGWFSTLPSVLAQGLDFRGDDRINTVYIVVSPHNEIVAATLAWLNEYPIAAALIVTATTFAGILVVIAFAIVIAMYGF
jgi:hypothetical protein